MWSAARSSGRARTHGPERHDGEVEDLNPNGLRSFPLGFLLNGKGHMGFARKRISDRTIYNGSCGVLGTAQLETSPSLNRALLSSLAQKLLFWRVKKKKPLRHQLKTSKPKGTAAKHRAVSKNSPGESELASSRRASSEEAAAGGSETWPHRTTCRFCQGQSLCCWYK